MVNGREYPRKMVLKDDHSSEIRQTIDGCVSRALSGLVMSLRLPVPVSTLEKNLVCNRDKRGLSILCFTMHHSRYKYVRFYL